MRDAVVFVVVFASALFVLDRADNPQPTREHLHNESAFRAISIADATVARLSRD